MNDNYYEELGVEPGATRDEIRDAHRRRVADLEAAREKKGISESQLQENREQVARVRSAWNVLSDPFQRQRYDSELAAPAAHDDVELVDDDDGPQPGHLEPDPVGGRDDEREADDDRDQAGAPCEASSVRRHLAVGLERDEVDAVREEQQQGREPAEQAVGVQQSEQ